MTIAVEGFWGGILLGLLAFLIGYYGCDFVLRMARKRRMHIANSEAKYSYIVWLTGSEWRAIQDWSEGKKNSKFEQAVKTLAWQCNKE